MSTTLPLILPLSITLTTASILGLMLIWLSARVIAARVKTAALIGDQQNTDLLFSIRTQANFTEYAPLFIVLLAVLEASGANSTTLVVVAAAFIVSRLLHVFGMGNDANLKLRQIGMVGTFTCLLVVSCYGLFITLSS